MDIMRRSEVWLRAHSKNIEQEKYLEKKLTSFSTKCRRRTNQVQQQIFDIYHQELQPLQQEANKGTFQSHHLEYDSRHFAPQRNLHQRSPPKVEISDIRRSSQSTTVSELVKGASKRIKFPKIGIKLKTDNVIYVDQPRRKSTDNIADYWLRSLKAKSMKYHERDQRLSSIRRALNIGES
ncbi:hypothetical protein LOTGIDRAFT_154375 [Lottia gigantea]|uniref:Uncharacterized protein n=1 Tax=Lottia gigantea TaxID=225164 RepID=V4BL13_LOTGI|nr:hypothetical protein LOTGIDRAFT_154375 [Lottia gigantea]ESO89279.1 hypothetical protein LOTGIDRAFT_154375 [Lottia gigantea]